VLVSVRPYRGHLNPSIPLLEALVAGGHQVVVATAEELAGYVEELGFGWLPAGVHPDNWRASHPGDDANYGVAPIRAKVSDLLAGVDAVDVDLILRDPTDFAPVLAAEVLRRPVASFSVCHYLPLDLWQRLAGPGLGVLREEFGLRLDPRLAGIAAEPYLDVMPAALQGVEVAELQTHWPIRYEPRDEGATVSEAPLAPYDPPVVLVTQGTVFNDRARTWQVFLRALASREVTVIATGAPDWLAGYGPPLPANVRLAGYIPHGRLLPECRVVVCHGGFNTVLGAICAGVPVVCVPVAGDQYHNAAAIDRLGLGIQLASSQLTQRQLRDAVDEILSDDSYRERVDGVRRQIAEVAPAASAVPLLEALASSAI
jgi:UDP:flavonoid glycosyltransferase YjiC (YdhE family)